MLAFFSGKNITITITFNVLNNYKGHGEYRWEKR